MEADMTTTSAETRMLDITLKDFIGLAEDLAADWQRSVEEINISGNRNYEGYAVLSPELRDHIRITTAMHILSQYYTVMP
jgi:hypothetical protein